MAQHTFEITAPNGKTLEITGDHIPTESEMRDIFKAAGVTPDRMPTPVKGDEPDSYWAGFVKGAREGIVGGAKGFVKGMASSPSDFLSSMVNLVTQSPVESAKQVVQGIQQIPEAAEAAGEDPEGWGQSVGSVTGQTMIGQGIARGVRAGVPAVVNRLPPGAVAKLSPDVVGIGFPRTANAIRALQRAMGTPETGTLTPAEIRQLAAEKYGMRLADQPIQRGPSGRPIKPPVQVTPPPETPPVTAPVPAQTPTAAPASAEPAAPTRTPAKPSTPISLGVAIKQAVDAFADAKTMPLGGEVSNAAAFVQRGFSPAEAVAKVLAKRPAVPQSAAEALAQRLGTPSNEAVAQSVLERNATGKWKK